MLMPYAANYLSPLLSLPSACPSQRTELAHLGRINTGSILNRVYTGQWQPVTRDNFVKQLPFNKW